MSERLHRVRSELIEGLDAFLIADNSNVRYVSGFTGSYAFLLITTDEALLLTDGRYVEQASQQATAFKIERFESNWAACVAEISGNRAWKRIGFESSALTYAYWSALSKLLEGAELIDVGDPIVWLRAIKDEEEIAAIRHAAHIADVTVEHIRDILRPGMSEIDIALEIDCFMRRNGAEKEAFETLAASGQRSALPHGKPTERTVSPHDLLLLDFGARWHGYNSDITRTLVLGQPEPRQIEIHRVVLDAQSRAIEAIRPGVLGGEIDHIARSYIEEKGFGRLFDHNLGHGLGLDVHDGPYHGRMLGRRSEITLEPGMVVTVEPGIYVPGYGGLRIEDDVLITESGAEVLTHASRDLSIPLR